MTFVTDGPMEKKGGESVFREKSEEIKKPHTFVVSWGDVCVRRKIPSEMESHMKGLTNYEKANINPASLGKPYSYRLR